MATRNVTCPVCGLTAECKTTAGGLHIDCCGLGFRSACAFVNDPHDVCRCHALHDAAEAMFAKPVRETAAKPKVIRRAA